MCNAGIRRDFLDGDNAFLGTSPSRCVALCKPHVARIVCVGLFCYPESSAKMGMSASRQVISEVWYERRDNDEYERI